MDAYLMLYYFTTFWKIAVGRVRKSTNNYSGISVAFAISSLKLIQKVLYEGLEL